jgi:hypothetical protein
MPNQITVEKVPKQNLRHPLNCPCCNVRIVDSVQYTDYKLHDMSIAEESAVYFVIKCRRCKKEIGLQPIQNIGF